MDLAFLEALDTSSGVHFEALGHFEAREEMQSLELFYLIVSRRGI